MMLPASVAVLVFSALALLMTIHGDPFLLSVALWIFALSGLSVGVGMVNRLYVYTGLALLFHIVMATFAGWVLLNYGNVVFEQVFHFTVFTPQNLATATVILVSACLAILLPWTLLARRGGNLIGGSARQAGRELLGSLDSLPFSWFQAALLLSIGLAATFFLTNASVFEISYPYQARGHWVPWEIKKVPTILAACALAYAYSRRIQRGAHYASWLTLARLNFLVVSLLLLCLTGSRGLFTFLWLGFGVFELGMAFKRRGSLPWAGLFLALAWLAYVSWPYMRWYLAVEPTGEVLAHAFERALGLDGGADGIPLGRQDIRLGETAIIGAALFHLLYTVQLIEEGISLGGSTFLNLLPQTLPSWLDGVLWERPRNDNWRLSDYFSHGGGFLVVANAYWNGGLWVAVAFMATLSAIFTGFDRYLMRADAGVLYRLVYWLWLPTMIVQLEYGIQGLMRVIQILLLVILVQAILRRRGKPAGRPAEEREVPAET